MMLSNSAVNPVGDLLNALAVVKQLSEFIFLRPVLCHFSYKPAPHAPHSFASAYSQYNYATMRVQQILHTHYLVLLLHYFYLFDVVLIAGD